MKIAIPVEEDNGVRSAVCAHFGQTPYWAIYDTEDESLTIRQNTAQHGGGGCQAVGVIRELGAKMVYTLGMGYKAIENCRLQGIEVKSGEHDTVEQVVVNLDNLSNMTGGCSGEHGDCH